ncbi:multicopper oxidase domain-containing protein [Tessaracoccus sp. MC1865]|uniref:multicopper oxidase domain-containing protein n=2 Tax=Tessaracoccus sp. MC1865 TaxID=2760310 RepID=UPI001AE5FA8E|nr:multicopper oxidase domain-containing protein [Tessaracoccus sp. MC1865]QTO37779.1 multicopper oxidase domain-containing protein [Tessaracoccus sp. MC1865]
MMNVLRRSRRRLAITITSASLLIVMTPVIGLEANGAAPQAVTAEVAAAAPTSPTDETKVPHYFGPYPNWANSPYTLSTATVTVDGPGTGAEAVAVVDPQTGGLASITVTSPGRGYDTTTTVTVGGNAAGSTAGTATATVNPSGAVVELSVDSPGAGYGALAIAITGGGGTGATVTASGGVDGVTLADGGSGYTMPTVDFDLPDDPNGTVAKAHIPMTANGDAVDGMDAGGTITAVVVDDPGSGYSTAPAVTIRNGTIFDPINGATAATATTSLALVGTGITDPGSGYTSVPSVEVTDPTGTGTGATVTAVTDVGSISSITVDTAGDGYLSPGIKKFQDELPVPCNPGTDGLGCPLAPDTPAMGADAKFIPTGVPEVKTYNDQEADEYVIGLVQYRTKFSTDLPATLVRGYVQLSTAAVPGRQVPLYNELLDGTRQPISGYTAVASPQWLGPIIAATKNRPVRIVFRNLLPNGAEGDLFLPTDSTMMGSGMGPMEMAEPVNEGTVMDGVRNPDCTGYPKSDMCFKDNRATLHLHGGITPWISDGTPHQWITPAGEDTAWPEGVSVRNVPDMVDSSGAEVCAPADDGCSTFYYTNQQSARMMFYHDHSWGITRLNVYAGEAAGYLITDDTEKALVTNGTIPGADDTIPLIVQDRTFTPDEATLQLQDPTWDTQRWGGKGSFWYHHVYMPAQNPGDPSGMSAYGRWMYGPWFWPPASGTVNGPIANPYYDPACNLDDPATWQYQTDPFCEPEQIPGTPNISAGMEQFNDTPIVNGVAYPTLNLQPKSYRLRVLNAANDRFFNLQWYTADPTQGDGTTEVALKPEELAAAQLDPTVSPTPVGSQNNAYGPDWVQIASEGGFLPAPAVLDGQQPTTWITDPTRFDVGNVDQSSLLLAPAERADVIVDFSKFAGKTLIMYNDAPAAFPARVPSYDYYTGAPDLSPVGAPTPFAGYGPNTRTVMQVTIADTTPAAAFNLTKLRTAFSHKANGSGVFESGQHPVIVGQAAYNSAYGASFAASSNCNVANPAVQRCDGLVRVNNTGTFAFNTLRSPNTKVSMKMEPKAIHDEMNASTFDEFGRMQANLGIEAQPPTPGLQNVTLYPFTNPQTELIDGSKLPSADVKVSPISDMADGSQIWRFTHNGVDTHPIHFHLYDVQVLNRVTWDNIIKPTDPGELGWKDTVRMSPLEDTIVALRPIIPKVPFEVPNSVRALSPMDPIGSTMGFNNTDPQGNPTAVVTNRLVNFGWEYVYHCHILSHEEMDMMRPVSLALPPLQPVGLAYTLTGRGNNRRVRLTWTDNSITETSFVVQRTADGTTWVDVGTVQSPLDQVNTRGGTRELVDATSNATTPYRYRVQAVNTVGYGAEFPSLSVRATSLELGVNIPGAPTQLVGALQAGPRVALTWRDNASNESGFVVERSTDGGTTFAALATPAARNGTGNVTFTDTSVTLGSTYQYRVTAANAAGASAPSNTLSITVAVPATPANLAGTARRQGNGERVTLTWADLANESGYTLQWSTTAAFTTVNGTGSTPANTTTFTTGTITRQTWFFRVRAANALGTSAWSPLVQVAAAG